MSSSSLVWQLVKGHHAHRFQARRGVQFSNEAGNVLNINSANHTGYTKGAIDIRKKGKGIKVGLKSKATIQKPRATFKYTTYKSFGRSVNLAVGNLVKSSARPGLVRAALARVSRLNATAKKSTAKPRHRHVRIPLVTRRAMALGEKRAQRKKARLAKSGKAAVSNAAAAAPVAK